MLKPQDIVVLLALIGREGETRAALAGLLGWDEAGVHRSLKRLAESGLYDARRRQVAIAGTEEFLVHGARYVFPARLGPPTRGVPTAWAAEPLSSLMAPTGELPPVWPDALGKVRGSAFAPLHAIAVKGALSDPDLHRRLALVDAIRGGDARARALAADRLGKALRE